ncbi:MAG: imelysin family protein [Pseudomonadota bacterium]
MRQCFLWVVLGSLLLGGCSSPPDQAYGPFLAEAYTRLANDYDALAARAGEQQVAVEAWCEGEGAALAQARDAFSRTVLAWSRVEWLRLGPVADDHRYERLFYWPDRGLRGRRQVERYLAAPIDAPLDRESLANKSVAFQGLPALELVLYGGGARQANCALARPLVALISELTTALATDWHAHETLASAISVTDEPLSGAAAVAKTLSSAGAALEVLGEDQIALPLGASPEAARPALAPFALSSVQVAAMDAQVDALHTLFAGEFQALLPEAQRYQGAGVLRELQDIDSHLDVLASADTWQGLLVDEAHRKRLTYLRQPLASAAQGLSVGLTGALGLSAGFNATDGD